jgi:UDP-N-acetylglucosamine 2-epimerase (non-hydrolysing)
MKFKVLSVLGTRPEIIKFSPLLPLFDQCFEHKIVHTGQHYSQNLDAIFFAELRLRSPDYFLNVGSLPAAAQVGVMMEKIDPILQEFKPDVVVVQGDTNSALAGGLSAAKHNIQVAHVEAGCRSFNWLAPEEKNRVIIDRISDYMFTPDSTATKHLLNESYSPSKIFEAGNTGLDAAKRVKGLIDKGCLEKYGLASKKFVLVTLHRAENTDKRDILSSLVEALNQVAEKVTIVFPIHPRTQKSVNEFGLSLNPKVKVIEPTGSVEFSSLLHECLFVMSDSGGIQEESAVMNVPCLILRTETEWTRLVEAGKNFLVGTETENIVAIARRFIDVPSELEKVAQKEAPLSFGSSEKICEVLQGELQSRLSHLPGTHKPLATQHHLD